MRGVFQDGQNSLRHAVEVRILEDSVCLENFGFIRSFDLSSVQIVEPVPGAPLKFALNGQAILEIDRQYAKTLPERLRSPTSWYDRMVRSYWHLITTILVSLMLAYGCYKVLLPLSVQVLAEQLPANTLSKLSDSTLQLLDKQIFLPSSLSVKERNSLLKQFDALRSPTEDHIPMRLVFRSSAMGPNAFALPDGNIVLTDELVKLVNDNDAVMGALAHEIGHIQKRHLLRQVIQTSVSGVIVFALFGDSSSILAALSTAAVNASYSKEFETEADRFAIARFEEKQLSLESLLKLHQKLATLDPENTAGTFLSSHPGSEARLSMIRKAMHKPH